MRRGGEDVEIVSTGCRPPSVPRPGRCRYICKRQLCGFTGWALCLLEGGPRYPGCYCYICKRQFLWIHRLGICPLGGADRLASGLQFPLFGTVWATHGVSCSVTFVVVRWAALRGKGVVPPWGDLCVLWHPSEDVDLAHRKVLCHFQAKWVISRTGQSSKCERIHLTDDTPLCMRHLNRIWMVMQRFNTYEFAIIGRERL